MLALDVRIAFGLLELLLHFLQRHLLPLEPLPVLEEDNRAIATTASIATTAPISCSVRLVVTPSIAAGSNRTIASRRCRSGHSIAVITAPSAITLNRPLAKFAAACLPKIRLKPGARRDLAEFRLQRFGRPHQPVLDHVAGDRRQHQHQERHAERRDQRISEASAPAPAGPRRRCGSSRNWRSDCAAASGCRRRSIRKTSTAPACAPAITNQVLTSWLLATSPRSMGIVQTFLRRVFCFVGCVVLLGHRSGLHLSGISSCMTPMK